MNRWDDPTPVEQIPLVGGLEFSLPVSDDGEASLSAVVKPGGGAWRSALSMPLSGVLIASNGVPVWDGWVTGDDGPNGRTFSLKAREWGHYFTTKCQQPARTWPSGTNDHQIFRDLVTEAQTVSGQNLGITVDPTTMGGSTSTKVVNPWDDTTVGREFRAVADADGGPEWYFGIAGSLDNPIRQLVLADQLGDSSSPVVLEYVEDTEEPEEPQDPLVVLLGDVFAGGPQVVRVRRTGGNVIAQGRSQNIDNAATVAVAIDGGTEAAQVRAVAPANNLLANGWPRMTVTRSYSDYQTNNSLAAHARADLKAAAGIATGYSLVTLESSEPDWTQVRRGSLVRVILDTDVYGAERPVGGQNGFTTRLRSIVVRAPSSGTPQVEWRVADVLEV